MRRLLLILTAIVVSSYCVAEGPYFQHKDPKIQQEFEWVWQALRTVLTKNDMSRCIDDPTFCVDTSNDRVGIGTPDPGYLLDTLNSSDARVFACTDDGYILKPLQPSFLAYNSATDSNVTGDGTVATVDFNSEIYDLNNDFASDTFTAPVDGKYFLTTVVLATNLQGNTHQEFTIRIQTSNRTYGTYNYDAQGLPMNIDFRTLSVIADMEASDTAIVTIDVAGSNKDVSVYGHASNIYTYFSGSLIN